MFQFWKYEFDKAGTWSMGLNSGAVIPSMARKLQIGQILRKLQNFEKTQNYSNSKDLF